MTAARGGRRPWSCVLALTGALAACGAGTLSAGTVARGAEDALQKKVGTRPDITCPKDLDATVGASTRCTLTVGKDPARYGLTVVVTSVKDGNATFDVQVDRTPQG
ncbi:MAG TPA: DUF4333 domain-containing protein [Blastococcus sp.]|jgi:hypothetical protein|nr:DUF4333 domain-containing protein [Blastococcus sp.]